MNRLVVGALLILSPPAFASEQCALPGSGFPPTPAAQVAQPAPPAADLAAMPFIRLISSAGAHVTDFGTVHGIRLVGARSGEEFSVYSVLPDGSAAVQGAPLSLTADQLTKLAEGQVTALGSLAGFDGLYIRSGAQFQVFYKLPDGGIVPGILRDAQGKNLTREQVRGVPGAIPTVDLQAGGGPTPASMSAAEPALAAVQKASFGSIGSATAPEVFMMVDPQCIYSIRAYQQLQPYAAAGKIRLSLVPVSILDHEDEGRSTKSALALLSKPPAEIPIAWQQGDTTGTPAAEATDKLDANMAVATAIGLTGTPTLLWRARDGKAMRIDGVPTDIGALIASAGG